MKNLKVTVKLILSFTIVILLSITVALAGILGMLEIKTAADDIYYYNVTAMDALGSIRENFALQRRATRDLVIFESSSERYKKTEKELRHLEEKMDEYLITYELTANSEEDKELLRRFKKTYYEDYRAYKVDFLLHANQNRDEAVRDLIISKADAIVADLLDILAKSHQLNENTSKGVLKNNSALSTTMITVEIIVLLIAIVIVVLLVLYLTSSISIPLRLMSNTLNHMGSTGKMRPDEGIMKRAEEDALRGDEIGLSSSAIINLLKHIWNIESTMIHISNGDFSIEVKTMSDEDTIGLSLSRVKDNLSDMFTKMKEAEETALAASKAKGLFLAHMSHEIRTPLSAIMGLSTIIGKTAGDREKTLASADKLMSSSRHLLSIVNDVLDMAKIESGKLELLIEPFSLRSSFDDVTGIIVQRCAEKNIRFVTNADKINDYTLAGDKTRINQVLINLLGNAVKFTDEGGEVRFIVEATEAAGNAILLKYCVIDNGIGMSKEQISRLFMPFEQGDSMTATRYGGTGLGLSISHNLVGMMGGMLSVESEQGEGTSFCFTLRLERGGGIASKSNGYTEHLDLRGKRVLLVEDIEINREIMIDLLGDTGLTIDEADNGQTAFELFTRSPEGYYDFIFMDVQMPVMDGYEATQLIRAQNRKDAGSVPIVAMTANAYKEDVERSLSAGMNGHLSKPVELGAILKMLREFIG